MMKMLPVLFVSVMAVCVTQATQAQGLYLGGNLARTDHDRAGYPDFKTTTLNIQAGGQYSRHFAIEARLGFGVRRDRNTFSSGERVEVDINRYAGLYAKGLLPLYDRISLYALSGFSGADYTLKTRHGSVSDSDSDFSWGVGTQVQFNPQVSGQLEWISVIDGKQLQIGGWSLGVNYFFE